MRSTIEVLNTSRSGPGQFLTLVGYTSVLPEIAEAIRFESELQSPQKDWMIPDKAPY